MAVDLIFETHSLTTDNEAGVATGWLDGRLSAQGRDLAAELGRRRRADGPAQLDAVFSSDLGRAAETVQIAFDGSDVPVHLDWRLRECDYGDLNGMPVARLAAERPLRLHDPFPGGESYQDVVRRMDAFLADLASGWDGRRVLLIGHTATRWSLDHLLLATPLRDAVLAPFDWREGWSYVLPAGADPVDVRPT